MENQKNQKNQKALRLFTLSVMVLAVGIAMTDSVFSNYFRDAYNADAQMRGFIEFPRELPGLLCLVVVSLLAGLGELRMAIVAQGLFIVGIFALGFTTPTFNVMCIFLFINSLGMHLFFPLQDSIAMDLVGHKNAGAGLGKITAFKTAAGIVGSLIVFAGFRYGLFSFVTPIKAPFVLAGVLFIVVLALLIGVRKYTGDIPVSTGGKRLLIRKRYMYYYILAALHGAQKQIMAVFGPWILIEILSKGADVMSILGMVGGLIGVFFLPMLGKCLDRFGIRVMLYADAISFIGVYILYGLITAGFTSGTIATVGLPVIAMYGLFILDRMSFSMGMVRTLYLRSIAVDTSEITPTLSMGVSIDHVISIAAATAGGIVWHEWGPQYVFFIAAALSCINLFVAVKANIGDIGKVGGDDGAQTSETQKVKA